MLFEVCEVGDHNKVLPIGRSWANVKVLDCPLHNVEVDAEIEHVWECNSIPIIRIFSMSNRYFIKI